MNFNFNADMTIKYTIDTVNKYLKQCLKSSDEFITSSKCLNFFKFDWNYMSYINMLKRKRSFEIFDFTFHFELTKKLNKYNYNTLVVSKIKCFDIESVNISYKQAYEDYLIRLKEKKDIEKTEKCIRIDKFITLLQQYNLSYDDFIDICNVYSNLKDDERYSIDDHLIQKL